MKTDYTKWYELPEGGFRPRWSIRLMDNLFRFGITRSRGNYFSLYFGTIHLSIYRKKSVAQLYNEALLNRRYLIGLYTFLWPDGVDKVKRRWRFDLSYGDRDHQYTKFLN